MNTQRQSFLVRSSFVTFLVLARCGSTAYVPPGSSTTYSPTEAIQHGDVVVDPGGKVTNLSAFTTFLDNWKHHKSGTVQVTSYTTEGDPVIVYLSFDGKILRYTFDDSQDKFGGQNKGRKTTTCVAISARYVLNGTMYVVSGCQDKDVPNEILFVPSSNR